MPKVTHYETLTWPEVAELPRDLPLILPLGEGFEADQIAGALAADHICMLPALPYGWQDSILPVSADMLCRVIAGIFSGPTEEGFTRLIVVHNGSESLNPPGIQQLHMNRSPLLNDAKHHLGEGPGVRGLTATPQRVILIPCGHTEQHGYHLPMNTDTVIIGAIARGVVERISDEAETLPTLPYGVSMFRDSFAGTFSMGGRVFEDFLLEVLDVLVARGADRFYLMSGHGGNGSFLHNVVKYAGTNHRGIFAATTGLHTNAHLGALAIPLYRTSQIGGMGHAGELETSFLLHLRPDLCHMERCIDETDFVATRSYYMDWIEGGALIASPPWEDDTQTGAYGAGSVATAQKGAIWLDVAIREKIDHVREIHEQQTRRLAKRAAGLTRSMPGTIGEPVKEHA